MIYTCVDFKGHYIGGVALIVASNEEEAKQFLLEVLIAEGFDKDVESLKAGEMEICKVNTRVKGCELLANGDY